MSLLRRVDWWKVLIVLLAFIVAANTVGWVAAAVHSNQQDHKMAAAQTAALAVQEAQCLRNDALRAFAALGVQGVDRLEGLADETLLFVDCAQSVEAVQTLRMTPAEQQEFIRRFASGRVPTLTEKGQIEWRLLKDVPTEPGR